MIKDKSTNAFVTNPIIISPTYSKMIETFVPQLLVLGSWNGVRFFLYNKRLSLEFFWIASLYWFKAYSGVNLGVVNEVNFEKGLIMGHPVHLKIARSAPIKTVPKESCLLMSRSVKYTGKSRQHNLNDSPCHLWSKKTSRIGTGSHLLSVCVPLAVFCTSCFDYKEDKDRRLFIALDSLAEMGWPDTLQLQRFWESF